MHSLDPHHPATGTPFESLHASLKLIRRLTTKRLEQDRLAVTDFWALTAIADGETSPTALGHLLAVTPASMTQLLDRLERRRLIRRSRNPGDRRATVLALTAEGRQIQRRAGVRSGKFLDDLASELSPKALAALQTLSRELAEILSQREADPGHGG
jgi:MarR family transcriptional regulator, transcriptional regulator for hemolysin